MTDQPTLAFVSSHHLERPTRLVPAVVEALVDRISVGEFVPGELMPRESDLTEQYGVSRTVIREALRVLEEKGLVNVQQGRGTLVTTRENWNLLDAIVIGAQVRHDESLKTLDDLVQVRAGMESDLTRAAAAVFTEQNRAELEEAFSALTAAQQSTSDYITADRHFHDVILRAAGNEFGRQIVRKVHEWSIYYPGDLPIESIRKSHAEHTTIRDLVLTGKTDKAGQKMRDHILDSWVINRELILRSRSTTTPIT